MILMTGSCQWTVGRHAARLFCAGQAGYALDMEWSGFRLALLAIPFDGNAQVGDNQELYAPSSVWLSSPVLTVSGFVADCMEF